MTNAAKIATTRVVDNGDNWHGPIVEMTTDDYVTLQVNLPLDQSEDESDPIDRALSVLTSLAGAADSYRKGATAGQDGGDRDEDLEESLQEGLEDTFPASDPVSSSITSTLPKR
jgi:hypothetical protein